MQDSFSIEVEVSHYTEMTVRYKWSLIKVGTSSTATNEWC